MSQGKAPSAGRRRRSSGSRAASKRSATVWVTTLLVCASGAGLAVVGAQMTLAGVAAYQAAAFVTEWEKNGQPLTDRAWTVAVSAAQRATTLYPVAHGDYLDRLGVIQDWPMFHRPFGDPEADMARQRARDAYRASLQARPTWPYTWQRLAMSKVLLQEFDTEFGQALAQANMLGPYRQSVQRELATTGFAAWPHLTDEQRTAVLQSARFGALHNRREAKRIEEAAKHYALDEVFCASLDPQFRADRKMCR